MVYSYTASIISLLFFDMLLSRQTEHRSIIFVFSAEEFSSQYSALCNDASVLLCSSSTSLGMRSACSNCCRNGVRSTSGSSGSKTLLRHKTSGKKTVAEIRTFSISGNNNGSFCKFFWYTLNSVQCN